MTAAKWANAALEAVASTTVRASVLCISCTSTLARSLNQQPVRQRRNPAGHPLSPAAPVVPGGELID
jgi:hypothetical protein